MFRTLFRSAVRKMFMTDNASMLTQQDNERMLQIQRRSN